MLVRDFYNHIENLDVLRGSALGKAVAYAKNQKKYMGNYLLYGRYSLSNNAAENAIRPFTVGRKNWFLSTLLKVLLYRWQYKVSLKPQKKIISMFILLEDWRNK